MKNHRRLKDLFCEETNSIKSAWRIMDKAGKKMILVMNKKKLVGVVTDGDIRRELLDGKTLDEKIVRIMNKNPKVHNLHLNKIDESSMHEVKKVLINQRLEGVPVLNKDKEVVDCIFWDDCFKDSIFQEKHSKLCPAVIMAGGKGTRMAPYTDIIPKPLIPINRKPMIKHIMNKLYTYGCDQFFVSLNYKADLIRSFFQTDTFNKNSIFFQENKPLGTAGSLNLITNKLSDTFIVTNCDIFTDFNIKELVDFHESENNLITSVSSLKHFKIPYGVVDIKKSGIVKKISEKPEIDLLVNIGFYVLNKKVLDFIPKDQYFDMTSLIERVILEKNSVKSFPISENSWTDLGQIDEYNEYVKRINAKDVK
ncbi:MAG: sugar phosphate nucleotidyltransferase [bacterium]